LLIPFLLLFVQSCSTEETVLQNDSNIKTVTMDQAIGFLKQNPLNTSSAKTSKMTTLSDYNAITLEKITNSNQLLTVIPLPENNKQQNSRVLLLTVNDTLKSVVFTMYPDVDQATKEFSGRVLITSVKGEFYKGFRVKNGFIISKFILNSTASSTSKIGSKSVGANLTEPIQLQEVVIPVKARIQSLSVAYLYVYSWQIEITTGSDLNWDFGSVGGGGGGGGAAEKKEDPCDELKKQTADPVYQAKIQSLKSNTSLKKETGFAQKTDGTFVDLKNTSSNSLDFPQDINTIGFNHTHIDDYETGTMDDDGNPIKDQPIKIFSPKDVMTFLLLLKNANSQSISLGSIYGTVVTTSNLYTLKFEGNYTDLNFGTNFNDELDINYKKIMRRNGLEKGFLKFLKENDIKGISLYKKDKNGTNHKQQLDVSNKLISTPCN
jgi:hypothetical protein